MQRQHTTTNRETRRFMGAPRSTKTTKSTKSHRLGNEGNVHTTCDSAVASPPVCLYLGLGH